MTLTEFTLSHPKATFAVNLAYVDSGEQVLANFKTKFSYVWSQDFKQDSLAVFIDTDEGKFYLKANTEGILLSDGQWSTFVGKLSITLRPVTAEG
jgi:hypothetical protein